MIGHLKPALCGSRTDEKKAYRALYCSGCAAIRDENSLPFALSVNHETTLVSVALAPYLKMASRRTPCPTAGFLIKQDVFSHPALTTVGRISVVLAALKLTDKMYDAGSYLGKKAIRPIAARAEKIRAGFSKNFREVLDDYFRLTAENCQDYPLLENASGDLSEHIFRETAFSADNLPENHREKLADLFQNLGKLILAADHLADLESDRKRKHYNPILVAAGGEKTKIPAARLAFLQDFNRLYLAVNEQIKSLHSEKISDKNFRKLMASSVKNLRRFAAGTIDSPKCSPKPTPARARLAFLQADCGFCAGECCTCACQACGDDCCSNGCDCLCDSCCNDSSCCSCDDCCGDCCGGDKGGSDGVYDNPSDGYDAGGDENPLEDFEETPADTTQVEPDSIPPQPEASQPGARQEPPDFGQGN